MASYSCTTKYQNSSGGDWVELKLDWSYTNTATQATISATLYVRRDGYGPTQGDASYWVKINGTNIFNTSTSNLTVGSSWVTVKSGSKTINLTNSGASATSLTMTAYYNQPISSKLAGLRINKSNYNGSYWNTNYATQTGSLTATIPAQASACSAPTTVSTSTTTPILPNGSFTVSWSGAKSGTNNSINGYRVYYRLGATPTTSTYTGYYDVNNTSATSGSLTIDLSNATRGSLIYVGVVTKCNNTSYWSGIKTGGGVIRINDLPGKPTLNKSSQTIAYNAGGVEVTATVGSDTYYKTTPAVWYANSLTGSKSKGTIVTITPPSNSSTSATTSSTYYFWTYDGLEYSSPTSITITRNKVPIISEKPNISNSGYTYTAKGGTYTYAVKFENIVSNFSSGNYYIRYCLNNGTWTDLTNGSFSATTFSPNYTFTFETVLPTTITTISDYKLKFAVRIKAGGAYSQWWYYGAASIGTSAGNTEYSYAGTWGAPTLSTSPGPPSFTATITNDTRLTNGLWTITAKKADNSTFTVSATSSVSGTNRIFSISSVESPGSTITYTITGTNGTITKTTTFTRIMRIKTTITSVTFNSSTMNVYGNSDVPNGTITVKGNRGNDFDTNPVGAITAVRGSSSQSTNETIEVTSNAGAAYETTQNIELTDFFNGEEKTLGITKSSRYGLVTYNFQVTFTNKYNENITYASPNYNLNFDASPTISSFNIKYRNSNSGNFLTLGDHYIQQGQTLQFNYSIENYTYRALTISIQRGTSATNTIEIASTTITAENAGTDNLSSKTTEGNLTYVVPEINNNNFYWKIIVTQAGTNTSVNQGKSTSNVLAFTFPSNFKLNSIIRNTTGYEVNYSSTSLGLTLSNTDPKRSAIITLQSKDSSEWYNFGSQTITTNSGTIVFNGTPFTDTRVFKIILTTYCTPESSSEDGYIHNTRSVESGEIIVYVEEPTVSYRKNQLGINNKNPASNAILDIATASGKEQIFIRNGVNIMLSIYFEGSDTTIIDIP